MEIERKWVLPGPPSVLKGKVEPIAQGYIFTDNGELRLRSKGSHYYLTVKGDGDIIRDEWEVEIPKWVFETLWPKTEGKRVEKVRYTLGRLEIDVYGGHLTGLVTLECEFPNESEAARFRLPQWAVSAVEVTNDKAYKNKNLAIRGLPKGSDFR